MKNYLLFILVLANNFLSACGFYPYGEDTRISLFNPLVFGYHSYSEFYYSANSFSNNPEPFAQEMMQPNNRLWWDYCAKEVDAQAIDDVLYQLSKNEISANSSNKMLVYLYQQKDFEAINYLKFAKICEFFNSFQEDPWERNTYLALPQREKLIQKAIKLAHQSQNKSIQKRYAFLAIRLAWYNKDFDEISRVFALMFEKNSPKDILYYWSLYFKSFAEKNPAKANFMLAQVFAHAADKRFVCHQEYKSKVSIQDVLKEAKTNQEQANVYVFYAIKRPDKCLDYLKQIYRLNPNSPGLSFLLLREINKIEDYVFTPYYTLFRPSISYDYFDEANDISVKENLHRAEKDRLYANEVLQFLKSTDRQSIQNPFLFQSCQAYLQFINRDYKGCLSLIEQLEKAQPNPNVLNQLHIVKALALTAQQEPGKAVIPGQIEPVIIKNQKNQQFIFAMAKELEYLGNSTDAALLWAKLEHQWEEYPSGLYWKSIKNSKQTYSHYFSNYFDYIDAVYSPEQISDLIYDISKNKDKNDKFSQFKYQKFKTQISDLYDLLGTKYIRQNKLAQALDAFAKLDQAYWQKNYTPWSDNYYVFDKNPFYQLKYTPEFIQPKEPIRLNKYSITKQLMIYLQKAESKSEKDRDYYYFLVANAYYNMGKNGHVSMMRRMTNRDFYWAGSKSSITEDRAEFWQSNLAKKYYLLAKQHAQTDKFKALCLRMATRCEKNRIEYNSSEYNFDYSSAMFTNNQYYQELQQKYRNYFDDLTSNCDNFKSYFEARR